MILLVMGVSGAGKSTVASQVADALHWGFLDADDLHPKSNKEKLSAGLPLTDEDRYPWLLAIHDRLQLSARRGENYVLACSALKQSYREILLKDVPSPLIVLLSGSRELLSDRLKGRAGHFMNPALLDNQLETLEAPSTSLTFDISLPTSTIVQEIVSHVRNSTSKPA